LTGRPAGSCGFGESKAEITNPESIVARGNLVQLPCTSTPSASVLRKRWPAPRARLEAGIAATIAFQQIDTHFAFDPGLSFN
jgi:hypothetical protein